MKNKSFILVNAALLNISLIGNVYAEEANDIRDPEMVFNLRFIYPDEEEEEHY